MKTRLDVLLVERGLAESRTRAQALVLEGKVRVGGQVETKSSRQLDEGAEVTVEKPPRFVSRGGEKLEGAFAAWGTGNGESSFANHLRQGYRRRASRYGGQDGGQEASAFAEATADESEDKQGTALDVCGKVCLDVGSSTGGFTDCLLQHGAAFVMAVDVGTNQLAYSLRTDSRVWVRENFNARYMKPADLPRTPEVAVTDVSFISLRLILPPIVDVLAPGGRIVALIKPQFEVGKGNAPGGLVRDEGLRTEARDGIVRFAADELGLELLGLAESPIRGREMGNIEYLAFWQSGRDKRPKGI